VIVSLIFFFFSSRRRHTRFSRDWSSDVCSSDLKSIGEIEKSNENLNKFHELNKQDSRGVMFNKNPQYIKDINEIPNRYTYQLARSEERRVGKECRYRWSQ